LNKAIPHLNHISFEGALREYKIYGVRVSAKKKIVAFATRKPRVQIPPFTNASYIITTQFQRGFFPLFSWFVAENVISTFYLYQSGYFTRKILFVLFVCGCGAVELHTKLWGLDLVAFLVWLLSACGLSVGRGVGPHSQHGHYVEECGCECECMLTPLFSQVN